jgi:hypothetical protein
MTASEKFGKWSKRVITKSDVFAKKVLDKGETAFVNGGLNFKQGLSGKGHKPRKVGRFENTFQGRIL